MSELLTLLSHLKLSRVFIFHLVMQIFLGGLEVLTLLSLAPLISVLVDGQSEARIVSYIDQLKVLSHLIEFYQISIFTLLFSITLTMGILYYFGRVVFTYFELKFGTFSELYISKVITERMMLSNQKIVNSDNINQAKQICLAEANTFANAVLPSVFSLARSVGQLMISLVVLFLAIGKSTFISLIVLVVLFAFIFIALQKRNQLHGKLKVTSNRQRFRHLDEFLALRDLDYALQLDGTLRKRYLESCYRYVKALLASKFISQLPRIGVEFLIIMTVVISLAIVYFQFRDAVNVIQLVSIAIALQRMLPTTQNIYTNLLTLSFNHSAIQAINNYIVKYEPALSTALQKSVPRHFNEILIEDITVFSAAGEKELLSHFNCRITQGDRIAILGKSGSGKSTLLKVLCGLIEPSDGSISIDGQKVDSLRDIEGHIGYCPQETTLINESIYLNVTMYRNIMGPGNEAVTDKKVEELLLQLGLYARFFDHRGSLKTIDSESLNLSGGEKQRIGIARSLYKSPCIMLFDEITSNLDQETSRRLVDILYNLPADTVVLFVTHDVEILKNHDWRLVNI